jgi:hypothetical protein
MLHQEDPLLTIVHLSVCLSVCPVKWTSNIINCLCACFLISLPLKQFFFCFIWDNVLEPPLWTSGQSFWLQIQRYGFDSRLYHIFWEVVGLEWDPLSLVSTNEELLGRKSSGFGLEGREYIRRDPSRWPRGIFYPQNLALTSPLTVAILSLKLISLAEVSIRLHRKFELQYGQSLSIIKFTLS